MAAQIPHLNASALEAVAKLAGDQYTGSEITAFFRKAGFPDVEFDGTTKWRYVFSALEKLQAESYGDVNIARVLEVLCSPQEYFGQPEAHAHMVEHIDEIVSFYGLAVDPRTGKLLLSEESRAELRQRKSAEAQAFDSRRLHTEVIRHGRDLFVQGRHFHAVFECCKAFDRYVAGKSQIDEHGDKLMGMALNLTGTLKLNSQRTQTEINEQEGIMHLGKGLMRAIRNPEAHEPQLDWALNQPDALDVLSLISFLYRKIDAAIYFKMNP